MTVSPTARLNFIVATDDELENNEWRDMAAAVKLRKFVQAEIMREVINPLALAHHSDVCTGGAEDLGLAQELQAKTVPEILGYIYEDIDVDKDGSLSYTELQQGLAKHGVELSEADFGKLAKQMDPDGDETISRAEWDAFLLQPEPKQDRKALKKVEKAAKRAEMAQNSGDSVASADEAPEVDNPLGATVAEGADPESGAGGLTSQSEDLLQGVRES